MSQDDQKHHNDADHHDHNDQDDRYDPYYRNFPSNLLPVRTPFTRAGHHDAGHVFIYMARKWIRWSLLLDHSRIERIYDEARECIPSGFSQFWLLEKCYSTQKPHLRNRSSRTVASSQSKASDGISGELASEPHSTGLEEKLYVALREPRSSRMAREICYRIICIKLRRLQRLMPILDNIAVGLWSVCYYGMSCGFSSLREEDAEQKCGSGV